MMVFNDYKDTLKSYIHDDDKLVTYKWLSKEFEIHVNAAKDILKQYWEKSKDDEQLTATFLLIGQLKDESLRVEVVRDCDLEAAKSKFVKVHCEHIYSLQKSLPDIQQLAFSGEGDLRYSAIKCSGIVVREPQVISEEKNTAKIETKTQNGNIQKKSDESRKDDVKSSQESIKGSQNQKSKDSLPKEDNDNKEKSGKLSKEKQVKKKTEGKKPNVEQKKENKLNFFAVKPKEVPKEKVNQDKQEAEKTDCSGESQKDDNQELSKRKEEKVSQNTKKSEDGEKQKLKNDEKHTTKNDKKTKNDSKAKSAKNSRGTKRNRSQESSASSKRKRIVVMDSSEDESGGSSNEVEEEPMEVVEEPVGKPPPSCPSPPAEKRENGKRMVRKTVDKVYKDENGYLVTKREFVYEPAPEEDECTEVKKEEPKKSKPVEAKAKKQTSLMSFFKKS